MLDELKRRIERAIVESSVKIIDCDEEASQKGLDDGYFKNAYRVEVYWRRKHDGVPMGYRQLISKTILNEMRIGGGDFIDYFISKMIREIMNLEDSA